MKNFICLIAIAQLSVAVATAQDSDLVWQKDLYPEHIVAAKFTSDGNQIVVATKNKILIYETLTGAFLKDIPIVTNITKDINCFEFIPNTNKIVTGGEDGKLIICDLDIADTIKTIQLSNGIGDIAISNDGKRLIMTYALNVVDLESGKIIKKIKTEKGVWFIEYSPDNRYFVTNEYYYTDWHRADKVILWDGQTYERITELGNLEGEIFDLDYSPDGKYVAACGEANDLNDEPYPIDDGSIKIWDVEQRKLYRTYYNKIGGYEYSVRQIKFSNDSRFLIYSNSTGVPIYIFDLENGRITHSFGHNYFAFVDIDISINNKFILTVNDRQLFLLNSNFKPNFINEKKQNEIILYPNPTDQTVNIKFSTTMIEYISVKITDSNGTQVSILYDNFINTGEHSFFWNTSKYPSGAYYCTISGKSINLVYKIIVSR
jgi:WD40 repeat protein